MSVFNQLQAEGSSLSVLYVEDEDAISKQVVIFLKNFFNSIDVCSNGVDGLESYRKKHQDIVITDISMPAMDGLEMSRAIKEINPNAEIIVTTAFAEQELLLKAIDIGVEQYVLKPIQSSLFATALLKTVKLIKLEKRTKALNEKISNIINFQDNLIFLTDLENILLCNLSFLKFFGFKSLKDIRSENFSFTSRLELGNGYVDAKNLAALSSKLLESKERTSKVKIVDIAGMEKIFVIKMSVLPNEKEQIVSLADITDFEAHFKELEFKANHDTLTRVYNRMKFDSMLDAEISKSIGYGGSLSLIKFDVDGLTGINELFGAVMGDTVLIKITQVVQALIGRDDVFARYGDDEFVVLAVHAELGRAFDLAEMLRRSIFDISFEGIGSVSCSFGVVEYNNGESADGFLGRVSKLLKSAKNSGKNCVKTDEESEKKLRDEIKIKELNMLIAQFELVKARGETVTIYMYYKGLSVSSSVNIDSFNIKSGTLAITIPKRKSALFHHAKICYIKHDSFAKTVYAEVKAVYPVRNLVILQNFSQLNDAPIDRKLLRLQPARATKVALIYDDGALNGEISDISLNSIAVCAKNINGLLIGLDVKVLFALTMEAVETEIGVDARVIKFFADSGCGNYKIVLTIFPNKDSERVLMSYFSIRQMELIREISTLEMD